MVLNAASPMPRLIADCLPSDHARALLIARVWVPDLGPVVALVAAGRLHDVSSLALTCSALLDLPNPADLLRSALAAGRLPVIAALDAVLKNAEEASRDTSLPWLLAPCDLQAIKATGVTFVASLLERVIEEQARGDASRAQALRAELHQILGQDLTGIQPGSQQAEEVKQVLQARGAWSQYLEVGIGPDAEIFTKAPVLAAVGLGSDVGLHPRSNWNNPEPEIVLAVNSLAQVVGVALGNDVNLRDFEGRSALLLGKAKDNNGSCAIGPFIRLFDEHFDIESVRQCEIGLEVWGADGFRFVGHGAMSSISRDPLDLVKHAMGSHHQYPDGMMMFLGTMLSPTQDRDAPGQGFTHHVGDVVSVSVPQLGRLVNRVDRSDRIAPWTFGIRALMQSLAGRRP